jgi:hypothetical protein
MTITLLIMIILKTLNTATLLMMTLLKTLYTGDITYNDINYD